MDLKKQISSHQEALNTIQNELHKKVIGQDKLLRDILVALLCQGHILLEGVPGVAKTLTIETLATCIGTDFKRIQFTPDLLPSDLVGTEIYNISKARFDTKKGPIFTHLVLADEINRAPSKVQSALLEAMAERQVTIGDTSYPLESPFLVLATQNPIEQSGTYPLPEAELDRFVLKSIVDYPNQQQEQEILRSIGSRESEKTKKIVTKKQLLSMQECVKEIKVSESIIQYVSDITAATRTEHPSLRYGVSPRGSIALIKSAQAIAFIEGRDFVIPEDIKEIAVEVIAHRLVLSYEAIAGEQNPEHIAKDIIDSVKIQ